MFGLSVALSDNYVQSDFDYLDPLGCLEVVWIILKRTVHETKSKLMYHAMIGHRSDGYFWTKLHW